MPKLKSMNFGETKRPLRKDYIKRQLQYIEESSSCQWFQEGEVFENKFNIELSGDDRKTKEPK